MAEIEKNADASVTASESKSKAEKKKAAKSSKPGLGARVKKFFKDYKSELGKVSWYGRKQTIKSTGVVLVALVAVGAVIALLDLGFSNLIVWIGTLI